jgi:hypothetical protein
MTRKILVPLVSFLLTVSANAQYISLNKTEIRKLDKLIKTDAGVKAIYLSMEALAKAALTEIPNPIDTIVSEGHLSTDPKKIRTVKSLADLNNLYALAYTYQITKKPVYKNKCINYLMAWASVNHSAGNPINDTKLDPLLEAYDLIRDDMTQKENEKMSAWLHEIADAEIRNPRFASGRRSVDNNWNSHRIKVVGNIAYLLNNKIYQQFTDTSIQKQILKNLYPDGSGMDFEERDALHYHIYTLEPLLKIATVIKRATGKDYFSYESPSGSSIQKSVAFLLPYVKGEKVHHEFTNSKTAFDRQRAENKEPGYTIGADFIPETATEALSYAAYFEPAYLEPVKKLLQAQSHYPNWQSVLNAVRSTQKK